MSKKRSFDPSRVAWRLNLIFALVGLLFFALLARLAYMQVYHRNFYLDKMAKASTVEVKKSSVRGLIYDASGKALVENESWQALAFTRSNLMTSDDLKSLALRLSKMVTISNPPLKDRDKVDFYLADSETYRQVLANLKQNQKFDTDGNRLDEGKVYQAAVDAVKVSDLSYGADDEAAIYLFSQMNAVANFHTEILKTDRLTPEQIAKIASDTSLEGIETATDWSRKVLDTSLSTLVGRVSNSDTGLPAEEVDTYLKKGYSLNDRVGTSYLEKEYEEVLQGQKEVKEIHLDKHGNYESSQVKTEAERGKNLKLTIDLDYQNRVEAILNQAMQEEISKGNATASEGAYAVALDVESGAVLAMASMKQDSKTGQLYKDALGPITDSFVPGSVVKGATLTTAWHYGLITGNQSLMDQPIQFAGSAPIQSWFTQYGNRSITAVEALEYSSNTYMVQLALDLLGSPYGTPLSYTESGLEDSMTKLRQGFAAYGMGTKTGIDLPNESQGFLPEEFTFANYVTNSFGQFDTYTPLQLAQYAATVANDGKRLAPHLVEGIYQGDDQGDLGQQVEKVESKVLNQVDISPENMALIKQGFYQVVHGGSSLTTGTTINQGASVSISAKTGTAETRTSNGQTSVNTNVVAYAPSDAPKIAVSVVFPHNTDLQTTISHRIAREMIGAYQEFHPIN